MKQLVLASSSPARKELLERTGIPFVVDVSDYEEDMTLKMSPMDLAKHLSQGKAREVVKRHPNAVILGADSFAVFKNQLLGKPQTFEKAKEMLTMLSGQQHSFITGFTIIDTDTNKAYSEAVETKVYFRKLSAKDIDGYLAKEDVRNNAGAYRLQDLGSVFTDRIDGSFTNVMGLPMSQVAKAVKDFGIDFLQA